MAMAKSCAFPLRTAVAGVPLRTGMPYAQPIGRMETSAGVPVFGLAFVLAGIGVCVGGDAATSSLRCDGGASPLEVRSTCAVECHRVRFAGLSNSRQSSCDLLIVRSS